MDCVYMTVMSKAFAVLMTVVYGSLALCISALIIGLFVMAAKDIFGKS